MKLAKYDEKRKYKTKDLILYCCMMYLLNWIFLIFVKHITGELEDIWLGIFWLLSPITFPTEIVCFLMWLFVQIAREIGCLLF